MCETFDQHCISLLPTMVPQTIWCMLKNLVDHHVDPHMDPRVMALRVLAVHEAKGSGTLFLGYIRMMVKCKGVYTSNNFEFPDAL